MLTDKQIKALKPKDTAYYESDDNGRRGYGRLSIKVSPSGGKVFYFVYRFNKKRRFLPLGKYEKLSLGDARKKADKHGQEVFDGKDPREILEAFQKTEENRRIQQEIKNKEGNIEQLFTLFVNKVKKDNSEEYYKATKRVLLGEALSILTPKKKVSDVTPEDIVAALRPITKRGSLIMANRARSYLHAAFAFAVEFDLSPNRQEIDPLFNIKLNPVSAVPKALKKEKPSDRALNEKELATFWLLIENSKLSQERKILLRLHVLFGGRRVNEVIGAPWAEFDLNEKLWDRPAYRDKKSNHVLMPIAPTALKLLKELYTYTGNNEFLFGDKPPTDYAINQTVKRLIKGKIEHFTPKSLRATAKTLMGKIGIPKEFRDRYHTHSLSDISSKHYDKFDYLEQKQEVAEKWEKFLEKIISDHKKELAEKVKTQLN